MKKRLKMKITTVRQQTIVSAGEPLRLFCPICGREVEMLPVVQAIRVLGVDRQTLSNLVAASHVHSVQTVTGSLWVCKDSLFSGCGKRP
jgi:hypothetical protein